MRQLLLLMILSSSFFSCLTKTEAKSGISNVQLLIPDSTSNGRAYLDLEDVHYRFKLENKIGLSDLKKGADSVEVRLWYVFSFSISQQLYILKFQDTSCLLSYYRVYPRRINYDDENRNREWDPYADPIIDSCVSKSVLIGKDDYKDLHIDSIWFLKSQSELKISDSIGFTDCDSYIIEIADKKRFKYLRHHCAMGYYNKTKLPEILSYLYFCGRITSLLEKHKAVVPYDD